MATSREPKGNQVWKRELNGVLLLELRQLEPTGQTLSRVSCDFFHSYPEWQYTFFGLVKDAPDGRHFGWLQIIPAEIPLTRIWFEEQPDPPAAAGRGPLSTS